MIRSAAKLLAILAGFVFGASARAQGVVSIDSISAPAVQNFDGIGSDNTAALPAGWVVSTDALYALGKSSTDKSAGTVGMQALTSSSAGGFYNFANGENLISTDRSVGFLSNNINGSGGDKNLIVNFLNNTGATITDVQLSFDIEKYRTGTRANDIRLYYGTDSTLWFEVPGGSQQYPVDSSTAVVNPPTSINKSIGLSNLSIAHQSSLYIRWLYTADVSTNCHALGIDNVQLAIGPLGQADLQWDGADGASWDATSNNWKNSSGGHVVWNDNMPNNARFVDGGAGVTATVTISSSHRAGSLSFDAGPITYTLSGGLLELAGSAGFGIIGRSNAIIQSTLQMTSSQTWDVISNLTVSGIFALDPGVRLTKAGAGNVTLTGQQIHGGNSQLAVIEGTLRLGVNLGLPSRLKIEGNANSTDATVILEADQNLADLTISTSDAGHQGLDLSSPAAAGAFRSLRIYAADLAATKPIFSSLIVQGRLTPGDGIYDSSLASRPNSALGIAAINNYILIRPTRLGDLNLDGQVTISDFIDLSSNFGHTNITWQEGDLNFDGVVTISDFIDLASNFGGTYAGQTLPISDSDRQALDAFAAALGVSIPEPASILLVLFASLATRRPRRLQSAK